MSVLTVKTNWIFTFYLAKRILRYTTAVIYFGKILWFLKDLDKFKILFIFRQIGCALCTFWRRFLLLWKIKFAEIISIWHPFWYWIAYWNFSLAWIELRIVRIPFFHMSVWNFYIRFQIRHEWMIYFLLAIRLYFPWILLRHTFFDIKYFVRMVAIYVAKPALQPRSIFG